MEVKPQYYKEHYSKTNRKTYFTEIKVRLSKKDYEKLLQISCLYVSLADTIRGLIRERKWKEEDYV